MTSVNRVLTGYPPHLLLCMGVDTSCYQAALRQPVCCASGVGGTNALYRATPQGKCIGTVPSIGAVVYWLLQGCAHCMVLRRLTAHACAPACMCPDPGNKTGEGGGQPQPVSPTPTHAPPHPLPPSPLVPGSDVAPCSSWSLRCTPAGPLSGWSCPVCVCVWGGAHKVVNMAWQATPTLATRH